MKHSNQRDSIRRQTVKKHYYKRLFLKSLLQDTELTDNVRFELETTLRRLPRNSSITRVQNRCVLTSRSKGVYKKFKLSRLCFRELASAGALPGVYKTSW